MIRSLVARKTWLIGACALGFVALMPMTLRQMSGEPPVPPQPEPREAVRVEHEFIALDAPVLPTTPDPAAARAARRSGREPIGFADKAKRALLGDGRHRPEPFPRAR